MQVLDIIDQSEKNEDSREHANRKMKPKPRNFRQFGNPGQSMSKNKNKKHEWSPYWKS